MYFGSVRFFKHLILLTLLSLIIVPMVSCSALAFQNRSLNRQVSDLAEQAEALGTQVAVLSKQTDLQAELARVSNEEKAAIDADTPDYEALYPDMVCDTPIPAQSAESNAAYLTFDDGPSAITDTVLDVLAEKGVKATFFIVANQLDSAANQERLRRMAAEGHTIAIHSETHDYNVIYQSVDAYLDDFYQAWSKIREITGVTPEVFRFPGGSVNAYNRGIYPDIISEMLRRGFVYYDWNVSAQDAASKISKASVLANATNTKAYSRIVLLMHDSGTKAATAAALPEIIDDLTAKGYSLSPLDRSVRPIVFGYSN